jgi:hypothetical protein
LILCAAQLFTRLCSELCTRLPKSLGATAIRSAALRELRRELLAPASSRPEEVRRNSCVARFLPGPRALFSESREQAPFSAGSSTSSLPGPSGFFFCRALRCQLCSSLYCPPSFVRAALLVDGAIAAVASGRSFPAEATMLSFLSVALASRFHVDPGVVRPTGPSRFFPFSSFSAWCTW